MLVFWIVSLLGCLLWKSHSWSSNLGCSFCKGGGTQFTINTLYCDSICSEQLSDKLNAGAVSAFSSETTSVGKGERHISLVVPEAISWAVVGKPNVEQNLSFLGLGSISNSCWTSVSVHVGVEQAGLLDSAAWSLCFCSWKLKWLSVVKTWWQI